MEVSSATIAFAPKHNTKGRKDADEFQRQAKAFLARHDLIPGNLCIVDNKKKKVVMREQVLDAIDYYRSQYPNAICMNRQIAVAFFCHGFKRGIQFGFDLDDVEQLAEFLRFYGGDRVVVPLYACDTGRDLDKDRLDDLEEFGGDGGFADELRDALCREGAECCRLDAHTTAGHTTRNPNVRRFRGGGSPVGGHGGFYIVPKPGKGAAPARRARWKAWRTALRTKFKFDFPFMTTGEILADLPT